jgi:hypothetical protein
VFLWLYVDEWGALESIEAVYEEFVFLYVQELDGS